VEVLVCNLRGGKNILSAKCEPLLKGLHSNDASNVTADVISLNGASAGSTSSRHRLQPRVGYQAFAHVTFKPG